MTTNDIGVFISQYGFPIVACCALYYESRVQAKRHQEEAEKWASVLQNNTMAINSMKDAINQLSHGTRTND